METRGQVCPLKGSSAEFSGLCSLWVRGKVYLHAAAERQQALQSCKQRKWKTGICFPTASQQLSLQYIGLHTD